MKPRKSITYLFAASFLLLTTGLLTIIGSNGGGGGGSDEITTEEAWNIASTSFSDGREATTAALTTLALNSDAFQIGINPLAPPAACDPSGSVAGQLESLIDTINFLLDILDNLLFDQLAGLADRTDNIITRTPDVATICADEATPEDRAACEEQLSHFSMTQTLLSDDTGTLDFYYDDFTPLALGYAPGGIYYEISLSELKDVLNDLLAGFGISGLQLPDTFTGTIRITTTLHSAQSVSMTVAITQPITIAGQVSGQNIDITLASGTLLDLSSDASTGTGSVEVALGAINALFGLTDDLDNPFQVDLAFAGATLNAAMSNNGETIEMTNFGIGGQPLILNVDDQEALNLTVDTLGWTVNGTTQSFTFDAPLALNMSVHNYQGVLTDFLDLVDLFGIFGELPNAGDPNNQGTFSASVPAGTTMQVIPRLDVCDVILKVTSGGYLNALGTDYFAGSITVNTGECFARSAVEDAFPFEKVTCPTAP